MTGESGYDTLRQSSIPNDVEPNTAPRVGNSTSPEHHSEGDRTRQRSASSVLGSTHKERGAINSLSIRPNLLAISSAFGKSNATSSTSATTVPRVQRSFSSRSIATGRDSPSSINIEQSTPDVTSTVRKSRPIVSLSLPASPTPPRQAPRDVIQVARSVTNEDADDDGNGYTGGSIHSDGPLEDAAASPLTGVSSLLIADAEDHKNDDEAEVDYNAEAELVVWPTDDQLDPRVVLREQLRRSESARVSFQAGRARSDSHRSSKSATNSLRSVLTSNPWAEDAAAEDSSSGYITHHPTGLESTKLRPRRYFVLTSAGKPVFASRANWRKKGGVTIPTAASDEPFEEEDSEEMLTSLVGVIQAIISLYAVENDMIRYIDAGDLRIAFYLKAPIYLVAVSDWREPESLLRTQLDYLYLGILSVTTQASIASIFKQRSNFDLRRLLAGTDNILNGILTGLQETSLQVDRLFEAVSGALKVVPFLADPSQGAQESEYSSTIYDYNVEGLRDECTKALRPAKTREGMLYALLVSHSSLVTLVRPKDHSIHPSDLHILLSTVDSTEALRQPNSESWIPICLPRFNSRGFLHAFICYFDSQAGAGDEEAKPALGAQEESRLGLGVILVTAEKEGFVGMQSWKDEIVAHLLRKPTRLSSTISATPQYSLYSRLLGAVVPSTGGTLPASQTGSLCSTTSERTTVPAAMQQPDIQPIRHFWYKSKTHVQIFTPSCPYQGSATPTATSFTGVYATSARRRRALLGLYMHAREALHSSNDRFRGDGPAKLVYLVAEQEAVMGLSTANYELVICLPSHTPKGIATVAAQALARWIRKNERRIFLTGSSSF